MTQLSGDTDPDQLKAYMLFIEAVRDRELLTLPQPISACASDRHFDAILRENEALCSLARFMGDIEDVAYATDYPEEPYWKLYIRFLGFTIQDSCLRIDLFMTSSVKLDFTPYTFYLPIDTPEFVTYYDIMSVGGNQLYVRLPLKLPLSVIKLAFGNVISNVSDINFEEYR